MKTRRSAVFVVPNSIVGHELVFKHHTNKVVVGNYTSLRPKISEQKDIKKKRSDQY